jgi:hypothetical protein
MDFSAGRIDGACSLQEPDSFIDSAGIEQLLGLLTHASYFVAHGEEHTIMSFRNRGVEEKAKNYGECKKPASRRRSRSVPDE